LTIYGNLAILAIFMLFYSTFCGKLEVSSAAELIQTAIETDVINEAGSSRP
jgi:hypothetical protein